MLLFLVCWSGELVVGAPMLLLLAPWWPAALEGRKTFRVLVRWERGQGLLLVPLLPSRRWYLKEYYSLLLSPVREACWYQGGLNARWPTRGMVALLLV